MKFNAYLLLTVILFFQVSFAQSTTNTLTPIKKPDKVLFAYGGQLNETFLRYIINTTNKSNPKVCFIPTASGDNPEYIEFWNQLCKKLSFRPHVLKTFSASSNLQTFEEQLLQMDAIIVGAGNAVNMLAIWKAHGIDTVLKKAYDRGIVIAGGSAGSLCWFTNGYTGSRPLGLSKIEGLGFLNYSHSPHYNNDPKRKPHYQQGIMNGDILPGYACDDLAGVLFINGVFKKAVTQNKKNNSYFVSIVNGRLSEERLQSELIK